MWLFFACCDSFKPDQCEQNNVSTTEEEEEGGEEGKVNQQEVLRNIHTDYNYTKISRYQDIFLFTFP